MMAFVISIFPLHHTSTAAAATASAAMIIHFEVQNHVINEDGAYVCIYPIIAYKKIIVQSNMNDIAML
jgi:hypothetical protein